MSQQTDNQPNNQINEEAYKAYMEAKEYFSKFKGIYDVPLTPEALSATTDISNSELPIFTEEENINNIRSAMRRLYGDDEIIEPIKE